MPWFSVFSAEETQHNVKTAEEALARSDLQHAFFHISSALCTDPLSRPWRAILDEVIRRAPDAEVFARTDQAKLDFITVAGRAYVRAARHDFATALPLLGQVARARPDAPFLLWAREWVQMHPSAVLLDPAQLDALVRDTLAWVGNVPSPAAKDDPRVPNLEAAADLFAALRQPFKDPFLFFASSMVLRRLARFDEAIALAHQAFQMKGDWNTTIGVANAFKDAKRVDEAVQWYRHALSFEPNDPSPLLDMGDTLLEAQRWDEAMGAYQEVLARTAGHAWAEPSFIYARFKKAGAPADKQRLRELAETSDRARDLFERLEPRVWYVNALPQPHDATAKALRNVAAMIAEDPAKGNGGTVELKVTHPESPSVLTAFRLWQAAMRVNVNVVVKVERVQAPDPRAAKGRVDFVLWAYDGTSARPNVPPPDPRAAEAIQQIARIPFDLATWDGPARELAQRMGVGWIQQVASVMVHPPPPPSAATDPFEWVLRAQIAAALVMAHMGSEPWEQSARRRMLTTIALGPSDWTIDAVLVALAWVARSDAAVRQEVSQLFPYLESLVPKDGYTSWEHPLACTWLALGGLDPTTQQRLEQTKARIERGEPKSPPAPPQEEVRGGLTLAQYAEQSIRPNARRIPEWDHLVNVNGAAQEEFMRLQNAARMKAQGIDPSSNEGRAAEMIRQGVYDVEGAKQNAMAAAQQMQTGDAGDPDPVVFPGQKIARLSQYVGIMKGMQGGDMMGALARAGLDMTTYGQVAQAWGLKMATDPILTAKFQKMMTG